MAQPDPLATFWRQKSPGGAYWRCSVPAKHLPGRVNKLTFADLKADENGEPYFPFQAGDTSVFQFAANATYGRIIAYQQTLGIRCLVEVDDLYLIPAPSQQFNPDWQETFALGGPAEDGDRASNEAHRRIAGFADGIICSTERLASHYREINDTVFVCRNAIDPEDWPEPHARPDQKLRIGWAASHSHAVDQGLVRRAMEWAASQKGVEVYTIGYQPPWRGRVNRVPWTDTLKAYRRSLNNARLDVGICPLVPGKWADCKSDVKCLEMAMAGAFPVVSDVTPYADWAGPAIRCSSAKDWERAIRWCVANRDEVRALGAQAREHVLRERTISGEIGAWREAIGCAYVRQV